MRCKKIFWPTILCLLMILSACAEQNKDSFENRRYEHVNFSSAIEKEDCYLCGDRTDLDLSPYFGQDNVGLINMNTFDVLLVEINRYNQRGQLIETGTGTLQVGGCALGDAMVSVMTDADRGYARMHFQPSDGGIGADAVGSFLCQDCLDSFASYYFEHDTPHEIAVINFATREIRPLVDSCPWFTFGNYVVDCNFAYIEKISLQITYQPIRY